MPSDFLASTTTDRAALEARGGELVESLAAHHSTVNKVIRYTLLGGGKRLRALLCMWTHDYVSGSQRDAAIDAACALECVHTYSLIHDDLPCMDDDDLRRGKPSAHVRFGEATAILTGDALLTLAFEILASIPSRRPGVSAQTALDAVRALGLAAGTGGLITGQMLDLSSTGSQTATEELVERIHVNKTARLIAVAMEIGAIMGGADAALRGAIRGSGLLAGRAFQIVDDILDVETDEETLGKTPGKDVKDGKLTYPSLVGLERAREEARALVSKAKAVLDDTDGGGDAGRLSEAMDFIVDRVA